MTSGLGTVYRQPEELQRIWEQIRDSMDEASVRSELIGEALAYFDTSDDLIPYGIIPFPLSGTRLPLPMSRSHSQKSSLIVKTK